ncbi:MAG: recombinase family protein [Hyphomicrobiaceae bacterium]|nr:MAG: recombinase family protein [Hyphomicrobiaceae bacterium]
MTSPGIRLGSAHTTEKGVPASAPRVAIYLRVSTGRQVEHELSIPDQRAQTQAWAARRSWTVVAEYIDGTSATDDKRPEFQKMIERACDGENAFDVIVVHSFSRFFRDAFGLEFYVRKLAKHGVKLVSITQELGDDPAQVMMRQVIALFDEYQSKENAKHVLRSMKENARQGFWNGARPPFGYKAVEVERRGSRIKKKLAIDPVEAETVCLIFRLFLAGDNGSGPMGVKAIAVWLNAHGYRTRAGATWGLGPIHALLSHPVYAGRMRFNRAEARSRRRKSETEQVFAEVPAIIEPQVFEQVQCQLKARNPRITAPRVVTGPILLTGLAVCASCRGAMTLRTGTSKTGKVHRYYACSTCARQGQTACRGRSIRMDKLDTLVTTHLADRLLKPERLTAMLASLASRRAAKAAAVDERLGILEKEAHEANGRLRRLYKLVEDGATDMDEILKGRITAVKADRDRAQAALDRAKSGLRLAVDIRPIVVERFGQMMREKLTGGEVSFRKAYLGSIVDRVEVDDCEIRIVGRKDVLEQAVLANGGPVPGVRSFVRKWRTRQDSNL